MATRFKLGPKPLSAILLAAAVPLIAACGSSSSAATNAQRVGLDHRDTVTSGVVTHRPLHGTGGAEVNDDNPGQADSGKGNAAGPSNPCALVTKAEAQAIIGKPIASMQEAPLGPTCIYQPAGAKSTVTLTVQSIDFAKIKSQIHHPTHKRIAGHTAYCGDYGQPTTFVALPRTGVLTITAPCAIGLQFAAKALSRLKS